MQMATETKYWTIEELDRLPEDGNTYEVIRGELFVTPPPTDDHETIAARLSRLLDPFIAAHGLGLLYRPHAVMRFDGSQVEPDLMVRQPQGSRTATWDAAPTPMLVVEISSPSTRRRDDNQKRRLYLDAGVAEYWIVDPRQSTIRSIRPGEEDRVASDAITWSPKGATASLTITLSDVFGSPL